MPGLGHRDDRDLKHLIDEAIIQARNSDEKPEQYQDDDFAYGKRVVEVIDLQEHLEHLADAYEPIFALLVESENGPGLICIAVIGAQRYREAIETRWKPMPEDSPEAPEISEPVLRVVDEDKREHIDDTKPLGTPLVPKYMVSYLDNQGRPRFAEVLGEDEETVKKVVRSLTLTQGMSPTRMIIYERSQLQVFVDVIQEEVES